MLSLSALHLALKSTIQFRSDPLTVKLLSPYRRSRRQPIKLFLVTYSKAVHTYNSLLFAVFLLHGQDGEQGPKGMMGERGPPGRMGCPGKEVSFELQYVPGKRIN